MKLLYSIPFSNYTYKQNDVDKECIRKNKTKQNKAKQNKQTNKQTNKKTKHAVTLLIFGTKKLVSSFYVWYWGCFRSDFYILTRNKIVGPTYGFFISTLYNSHILNRGEWLSSLNIESVFLKY